MRRSQPVLLGGLFIGVLSALPVVGEANICCCLWVVVGGLLTTYLQRENQPLSVEAADAVVNGLLAGLVGALIHVVLQAVLFSLAGDRVQEWVTLIEENPQIPPDLRDRLVGIFSGGRIVLLIAAVSLPTYAVAGMLGALLGVAVFKKKLPPAPPVES